MLDFLLDEINNHDMFRSEGPSSGDHLYEYKIDKVQWSKVKKN
jgi:hypothetical protein